MNLFGVKDRVVIKILTDCLFLDSTHPTQYRDEAPRGKLDWLQKAGLHDQEPHAGLGPQPRTIGTIKRIADHRQRRMVRMVVDLDNLAAPDDPLAFVAFFGQHMGGTNRCDLYALARDRTGRTASHHEEREDQSEAKRRSPRINPH